MAQLLRNAVARCFDTFSAVRDVRRSLKTPDVVMAPSLPRSTETVFFQFMSDLNLEPLNQALKFDVPRVAPILILAGDIGTFEGDGQLYSDFLRQLWTHFDLVLLVLGNHDVYGRERSHVRHVPTQVTDDCGGRFACMDRGRVVDHIYRLVILGCALHSNIPAQARMAVSKKIPDFARTRSWTINNHNHAHRTDRKWLKREIARVQTGYRVFVVSHFPLSFDNTSQPKYEGNADRWHFGSETLGRLQACKGEKQIVAWGYGHTHNNTLGTSRTDAKLFSILYHRSTGNLFARDAVVEVLPPPPSGPLPSVVRGSAWTQQDSVKLASTTEQNNDRLATRPCK